MSSEVAVEMQGGRWKRYPAYRDSGVEWLGEVPEHWRAKRLKYITTANDETLSETTDPDFELVYVDIGSIDPISGIRNKETMTFENAPSRARRKVRNGDVIISTVRTYLRAISPVNDAEPNMVVSTGFAVIRPKENIESQFAAYTLRAPYFVDKVVANSVGVSYPAINASELINFNIALPPLPEQRAIAAFLDRETRRIDTLIEKKERQIELLQEKRAALISHAVTKGLDPDVKMEDSGVEWLGEVPEHWPVERLRFHILINPTKSEVHGLARDTTVSFVPMEAVREYGGIRLGQTRPIEEVAAGYTYFRDGDVAVAKITPCFENVKGAVVKGLKNGIGFGTTELHVLRPSFSIDQHFLFYLTISYAFRKLGESEMYGSAGQKRVPEDFIKNLKHPIPILAEQRSIAVFLDHETGHIDVLTTKVYESISKLREYRTALISAAVTGKIDVRSEET